MKKRKLAVTSNIDQSKMPCIHIIHVNVNDGEFRKRIADALFMAEEMNLKSVAFPALGAGEKFVIMMVLVKTRNNTRNIERQRETERVTHFQSFPSLRFRIGSLSWLTTNKLMYIFGF